MSDERKDKKNKKPIYRILFRHESHKIELYARRVFPSDFLGLVRIEDLIFFEDKNSLLINPMDDKIKKEFADTRVLHIPLHCLLRIEELKGFHLKGKKSAKVVKMKDHQNSNEPQKNSKKHPVRLYMPVNPFDRS